MRSNCLKAVDEEGEDKMIALCEKNGGRLQNEITFSFFPSLLPFFFSPSSLFLFFSSSRRSAFARVIED